MLREVFAVLRPSLLARRRVEGRDWEWSLCAGREKGRRGEKKSECRLDVADGASSLQNCQSALSPASKKPSTHAGKKSGVSPRTRRTDWGAALVSDPKPDPPSADLPRPAVEGWRGEEVGKASGEDDGGSTCQLKESRCRLTAAAYGDHSRAWPLRSAELGAGPRGVPPTEDDGNCNGEEDLIGGSELGADMLPYRNVSVQVD